MPFISSKKFFAVDASGSTSGSIMTKQRDFVLGVQTTANDVVCKWDTKCDIPQVCRSLSKSHLFLDGLSACLDRIKVGLRSHYLGE